MAKNFGNFPEMSSLLEHPTRKGVTEQMRRDSVGAMDTCLRHGSADDMTDTRWPGQRHPRSIGAQKDTLGDRPPPSIQSQILDQCPSDVLRQGQQILLVAFAPDQNLARSPADVPQLEKEDLAGSKPQLGQQKQDRVIASPGTAGPIWRRQHSGHFLPGQQSGNVRLGPPTHRRDCCCEIVEDMSLRMEKAQEGPQTRAEQAHLRAGPVSDTVEQKASQNIGIQLANRPSAAFLGQVAEQVANQRQVHQQGALRQPLLVSEKIGVGVAKC